MNRSRNQKKDGIYVGPIPLGLREYQDCYRSAKASGASPADAMAKCRKSKSRTGRSASPKRSASPARKRSASPRKALRATNALESARNAALMNITKRTGAAVSRMKGLSSMQRGGNCGMSRYYW